MKKYYYLFVFVVSLFLIISCSENAINSPSVDPVEGDTEKIIIPPSDSRTIISDIEDVSSYAYIGIGEDNTKDSSETGTARGLSQDSKVRMLGIKPSGKVDIIRFKDKSGTLSKNPFITANLSSGDYEFCKISFDDSTYCGSDFSTAKGNVCCVCTSNGKIYKLDDVVAMETGFGTYDYYDGVFVGCLTFSGNDKRLCKIYIDGSELKVEKKLSLVDFPEFGHMFLDRNHNIFAVGTDSFTHVSMHTGNFHIHYILTFKDNLIATPGYTYAFLGFNRIVYSNTCVTRDLGEYDDINNPRLSYVDRMKASFSTIKPTNYELYIEYLNDVANLSTSVFMPPEINYYDWANCHHEACLDWWYSELLYHEGETYYYLTDYPSYGETADKYLLKVTFNDSDHLSYSIDYTNYNTGGSNPNISEKFGIKHNYVYENKKLFYMNNGELRIVDIAGATVSSFTPSGIVLFHSLEKANGNEVTFEGTNTSAQRVYYKIDTDTLEIEQIGETPTFGSVSFKPLRVE